MDLKTLLFSIDGRIGRQKYIFSLLLTSLASFVISFIVAFVGALLFGRGAGLIAGWLLIPVNVWVSVAIAAKRLHDRDRSAWFMLIAFVPIVGIWFLVEVLFLKGTEGDNRFGKDPLV